MDSYDEIAERPWGAWKVVHQENSVTVKVLTIAPGGMLSLQSHNHRSEQWLALDNGLIAYHHRGDVLSSRDISQVTLLDTDSPLTIYAGSKHRLINPTDKYISVVEVIRGRYDENDITRYQDAYGR